ncbi:hypothetical protein [Burkholderia sp. IMCC1007]|nr:hypothetical protein [Burkholderia sp. IMCC1007]
MSITIDQTKGGARSVEAPLSSSFRHPFAAVRLRQIAILTIFYT